jgi:hypothetical protein
MASIEIGPEIEGANHWRYQARVLERERSYDFDVTLSWSDYDLWCRGRAAPSEVVRAALAFLLEREPAGAILRRFDCSVIRRYFPDVDRALPGLIVMSPRL